MKIHDLNHLTLIELFILDKQQRIAEIGIISDIEEQLEMKLQIERNRLFCGLLLDANGGWLAPFEVF